MSRPAPVQFRSVDLEAALDERGPRNATAQRDLYRYYTVLTDSLAAIRRILAPDEILAVADVLNGTLIEPASYRYLWAEVADAIADDELGATWGVTDALIERLRHQLTPGETMALVDAIERAWLRDEPDMVDRLRGVGLIA